jgi:acetyl-CoA/propionyl-CoA carboxylase biotin carboxyl carrier protein
VRDELTPREVAQELGVSVRTVQRWIAAGRLPGTRVGGRMRVSRAALPTVAEAAAVPGLDRPEPGPVPARFSIQALLIANRGEIAARIARTARAQGIRVIRVHEPDEPPPDGGDLAVSIPSYLDGDALIEAARRTGADAIHPGYGYLAENPDFAAAVQERGLVWVGPPPKAIAAMGDKAAARRLAAAHDVPVVPGYDGPGETDTTLVAAARAIGLPVLVKPAGGGGGKGMHVVRDLAHLPDALATARREAGAAFGDERLILERLVERPRHVEVQVLFDEHGHGVHLGERDCSAQRRNQKIVEEAPAPSVGRELRERIGAAALRVAAAAGYVGAGTVEFLVAEDGSFFFLEMNTRLQVEHPVTEAVTGRDLVADQLRIAVGDPLGLRQEQVRLRGHSIEARLYAEDPEHGFLPATGRVVELRWPAGIRVDAGVGPGDLVTDRYDPLVAKLIVHGPTRDAAVVALRTALAETRLLGVRTNLRFLRWLVEQAAFAEADIRTDTLASISLPGPISPPDDAWSAAAAALATGPDGPWSGGWRLNAEPSLRLAHGDEERAAEPRPGLPVARHDDTAFVDVEGQSLEFRLAPPPAVEEAVRHASRTEGVELLTAPMPGRVVAVRRRAGEPVTAHEPVVVLEAMKMEHTISAPLGGTVTAVHVEPGDQVQRGDVLAEVSA